MALKAAVKKRLVKALRSGKYTQTQFELCNDEGFCVLGVLYDIEADDYWVLNDPESPTDTEYVPKTGFDSDIDYLPPTFMKQVGLTRDEATDISLRNDSGDTFEQIANYIERWL
jgi:hypothetical protein